jgi:hypothetical protein
MNVPVMGSVWAKALTAAQKRSKIETNAFFIIKTV